MFSILYFDEAYFSKNSERIDTWGIGGGEILKTLKTIKIHKKIKTKTFSKGPKMYAID